MSSLVVDLRTAPDQRSFTMTFGPGSTSRQLGNALDSNTGDTEADTTEGVRIESGNLAHPGQHGKALERGGIGSKLSVFA